MLELSIRLEQYFKFNCKICFQLIYLCISNFIGMRDWSDFKVNLNFGLKFKYWFCNNWNVLMQMYQFKFI